MKFTSILPSTPTTLKLSLSITLHNLYFIAYILLVSISRAKYFDHIPIDLIVEERSLKANVMEYPIAYFFHFLILFDKPQV
jgi:hypothetical protein